ncbi:unnamed protein product [Pedinophyceae sp. YPF-701]|nr:unnamed protein product [Pedinophyceae sp. YPF-701]
MEPEQVAHLVEALVFALMENETTAILEDDMFGRAVALAQDFALCPAGARGRYVDALTANLHTLAASCGRNTEVVPGAGEAQLAAQYNALKVYCFLLTLVLDAGERQLSSQAAPAGPAHKKGSKSSKNRQAEFVWELWRPRVARSLAAAAAVDLWALSKPSNPDPQLVNLLMRAGVRLLETAAAMKDGETREAAAALVAYPALKFRYLEQTTSTLAALLSGGDHVPGALVGVCDWSFKTLEDNTLAQCILAELTEVDPRDYKNQQAQDSAAVRHVGEFIAELAERQPRAVASQMALLMPHLGGEAHSIRSGIVSAMGSVIHGALTSTVEDASSASSSLVQAKLQSKQHLLATLMERVRDSSAFTRARVMQTWALLADRQAVPISHWNAVAELVVGRLEDKSSLVRKAALGTLMTMLLMNPFGKTLPLSSLESSLADFKAQLERVSPQRSDETADPVWGESSQRALDSVGDVDDAAGGPLPEQSEEANQKDDHGGVNVEQLRALVASLDTAVQFVRLVSSSMPVVTQLLASPSNTDVIEAITFIVMAKSFDVDGAASAARKVLPLIFHRELPVAEAVAEAAQRMYFAQPRAPNAGGAETEILPHQQTAMNLVNVVSAANVGELSALETVISKLLASGELRESIVLALWDVAERGSDKAAGSAMALLAMVAAAKPEMVAEKFDILLKIGFDRLGNALLMRHACTAISNVAHLLKRSDEADGDLDAIASARDCLLRALLASDLSLSGWFSLAETAIKAIFDTQPKPDVVAQTLLEGVARLTVQSPEHDVGTSSADLSKLFYVVGQAANEDIAAQLGTSSSAKEDAEVDAMNQVVESQLLSTASVVGRFAPLVVQVCADTAVLARSKLLRSSALLALTKLMAVDGRFCERNLPLVFTLLQNHCVEPSIRQNLVIAVGDLAYRFPNALEPWTEHIYKQLTDADPAVRKNTLMVLTHLILNDMMKVKGHVARVAVLLEDSEPNIQARAQLFFTELSHKSFRGSNPIYNMLPDVLSSLSKEQASGNLGAEGYKRIMAFLLTFISKDKHTEGLVDKLCQRYYQDALVDEEVAAAFQAIMQKAKKQAKDAVRQSLEELEQKMVTHAEERAQQEAAAAAAAEHMARLTVDQTNEQEYVKRGGCGLTTS